MNKRWISFMAVVLFSHVASAQEPSALFTVQSLKDSLKKQFKGFSDERLFDLFGNPSTLNKYLEEQIHKDNGWKFLKDINFQFKTFSTQGTDSLTSLGFSYQFAKEVSRRHLTTDGPTVIGQAVSMRAQGNVAFDARANPKDFLESQISIGVFGSHGGVVQGTQNLYDLMNALDDSMAIIEDEEMLNKSTAWLRLSEVAMKHLSTQVYWSFSGAGALESNQTFTAKQYVYGFETSLDVKAWSRQSVLASLNVFDWPFACLRWLSGNDADFTPLGSTIPTVILGMKRVNPNEGDPRRSVDGSEAYYRLNLEAAFRTPVGNLLGERSYVHADFRYYREIDPTPAVVAAGFHRQTYFTGALMLANGFFVSYTAGRLPFDAKDDQIYEMGFQYSF